MKRVRAAVFASGSGSNFQVIIDQTDLPCEIAMLVCDNPTAPVIQKAERAGIDTFIFEPGNYQTKEEYESQLVQILKQHQIQWIFLAGYMRLVGSTLLNAYEGKIINIHPSLLPDFPGIDAIGQALREGVSVTGVTVHYIDEGIDTGPIIAQRSLKISKRESLKDLTKRIQAIEHQLYPEVIKQLIK